MRKLAAALLLAASAALPARAAIICVAPTSTTAGSVQITTPITFTITASGNALAFALDEWVTSDGTRTPSLLSPNLGFSLDGTAGSNAANFYDNAATPAGSLTANDGYFAFNNFTLPVLAGDTLTLLAGTYTAAAVGTTAGSFNPQATQTFTGNLFVLGSTGTILSNTVSAGAVPEPSAWEVWD